MRKINTTVTLDLGVFGERECSVIAKYYKGHPGSWYRSNGDPGDPPEPDEVEVISVSCDGIDLTDLAAEYLSENDNFLETASELYYGAE